MEELRLSEIKEAAEVAGPLQQWRFLKVKSPGQKEFPQLLWTSPNNFYLNATQEVLAAVEAAVSTLLPWQYRKVCLSSQHIFTIPKEIIKTYAEPSPHIHSLEPNFYTIKEPS